MDCRYTGVECRRRVAVEELRPGGSCGVHSWIEGASDDGRRVSWFAPQNQGGGRRLKTPSLGGTGVGLGTDGGDGRRRRLEPRRGGGNLPAREVLTVFLKTGHLPGFRGPPKTVNRIFIDMAASQRRLRLEERTSTVGWVLVSFFGFAPIGFLVSF